MVEDHGEAVQRLALQDQKNKLSRAAERLEKLVEELKDTAHDMNIDMANEYDDGTIYSEGSQAGDQPI